jgi:hypothetical protein
VSAAAFARMPTRRLSPARYIGRMANGNAPDPEWSADHEQDLIDAEAMHSAEAGRQRAEDDRQENERERQHDEAGRLTKDVRPELLGFDGSITQQQCGERKGRWVANSGDLLHVWTVPSYTNPLGVFAHMNPLLTCGDGTYYTDDRDITNQCREP